MQSTNTFELARYGADLKHRIHDMPIGDPLAGAPYGEYLKSKGLGMVIGIVASVVTMGAAMPLMAAGVSLASQIAGGVMMAGGVLSGVGAVTGNKKLSKIGGVMSLAGGLGGLAIGVTGGASGAVGQSLGKGSEALATMSSNFMDSASSLTGGLAYGDRVAGAGAEKIAGDFAKNTAAEGSASTIGLGDSTINPDNISNGPPGTAAPAKGDGVIKLADTPANTGSLDISTATQGAPVQNGVNPPPPKATGILSKTNDFLGENKELLKTGANAVEMGVKYGMGGDAADAQMAEALNRAKVYDAQAALLTTQNAQAQFQLANQNKKSVMISADAPDFDAKLAKAKADGAAIGIIPSMGTGGIKVAPGGPPQLAAQQVVRPSTYTQPTAGILNKAA